MKKQTTTKPQLSYMSNLFNSRDKIISHISPLLLIVLLISHTLAPIQHVEGGQKQFLTGLLIGTLLATKNYGQQYGGSYAPPYSGGGGQSGSSQPLFIIIPGANHGGKHYSAPPPAPQQVYVPQHYGEDRSASSNSMVKTLLRRHMKLMERLSPKDDTHTTIATV